MILSAVPSDLPMEAVSWDDLWLTPDTHIWQPNEVMIAMEWNNHKYLQYSKVTCDKYKWYQHDDQAS